MTLDEAQDLVAIVATICPGQPKSEFAAEGWHLVLDDIDYRQAVAAVRRIARNHDAGPLFIDPRQILNQARKTKADTHERTPPQTPPPTDPQQYLQWVRSGGREIARNNDDVPAIESDILSPGKSHKYREEIRKMLAQLRMA